MAVKRVFGTVDGAEVVLEYIRGDVWQVPVPLDQDGEYVVEIIAEDEAGNQAYVAKMLFVVNTALLCVHVVPMPYYGVLQERPYSCVLLQQDYATDLDAQGLQASLTMQDYFTELIEPVCSIRGRR